MNGSQIGGSESLVLATGVPELGVHTTVQDTGEFGGEWAGGYSLGEVLLSSAGRLEMTTSR